MEITNICPYCGKKMSDGAIPAVRDVIRWCRKQEGDYGDYYEEGVRDGVELGRAHVFSTEYIPAFYCEDCRAVILPVQEVEWPLDKLDKKLTAWQKKMSAQREERKAQREEKKSEQKREEKRKKDPWEV